MRFLFLIFSLLLLAFRVSGQVSETEHFITINGNLYVPVNSQKGMYPILWYDKETQPKVLIGGVGLGFLAIKPLRPSFNLRAQANLSKHSYWDEAFAFKTNTNMPAGNILTGSSDYSLGATGIVHYTFTGRSSIGTGLGVQVLLVSLSRTPLSPENTVYRNRHYRPLMPVLPIELSYKAERKVFNIRYEQALLNRLRGDAREYRKDYFGLLSFEIGWRVGSKNNAENPEF